MTTHEEKTAVLQQEALKIILNALTSVANGDNPQALDDLHNDRKKRNQLDILSDSIVKELWSACRTMAEHHPRLLDLLAPLDNTTLGSERLKTIVKSPPTWMVPGLMDVVEHHAARMGGEVALQIRTTVLIAGMTSLTHQKPNVPVPLLEMLDARWARYGVTDEAWGDSPILHWILGLRLGADQPDYATPHEDLADTVNTGEAILATLMGHGLNLEQAGSVDMNGVATPYLSALHAACLILDESFAGETAVTLLINHGANVERVLAAGVGERSQRVIHNHPRQVAVRLGEITKNTQSRRTSKPRHI